MGGVKKHNEHDGGDSSPETETERLQVGKAACALYETLKEHQLSPLRQIDALAAVLGLVATAGRGHGDPGVQLAVLARLTDTFNTMMWGYNKSLN